MNNNDISDIQSVPPLPQLLYKLADHQGDYVAALLLFSVCAFIAILTWRYTFKWSAASADDKLTEDTRAVLCDHAQVCVTLAAITSVGAVITALVAAVSISHVVTLKNALHTIYPEACETTTQWEEDGTVTRWKVTR